MSNDAFRFFGRSVNSIPFVIDEHVSLTRLELETGREIPVWCVNICGVLHFHPQRFAEVEAALIKKKEP